MLRLLALAADPLLAKLHALLKLLALAADQQQLQLAKMLRPIRATLARLLATVAKFLTKVANFLPKLAMLAAMDHYLSVAAVVLLFLLRLPPV